MVPLAALIILSAVVVFATGTFGFAIYWTIKSRLEAKRLKDTEADSELRTPLTATNTAPGLFSRTSTPPPPAPSMPRPSTPEAEFPPQLPNKLDDRAKASITARPTQAAPSPPFLLPATTYRPNLPQRPLTPEADFPPPLPSDFSHRTLSPLPPHSPLLPPRPSLSPHNRYEPRSRSRSRGRGPNERPPYPTDKVQERPDSMHEIYDIYSKLPPTPRVVPKSAPPNVNTFAQAESKWGYIGQKRAESQGRDRHGEGNMI